MMMEKQLNYYLSGIVDKKNRLRQFVMPELMSQRHKLISLTEQVNFWAGADDMEQWTDHHCKFMYHGSLSGGLGDYKRKQL